MRYRQLNPYCFRAAGDDGPYNLPVFKFQFTFFLSFGTVVFSSSIAF